MTGLMKDKPRLLIIAPAWSQGWWDGGKVLVPPLVLPLLAGLTPRDIDVQLIDENVEPVDVEMAADWVAITCMTASAPRAYAISKSFRERRIPVVMGGIHPTVMPEEAALHADAIIIGEAEPVWHRVIADLSAGSLQSRYQSANLDDLTGLPLPRRELLKTERYLTTNVVQTARGCPNGCAFCTVSTVAGRRYRFRPINEVVEEIRTLGGWIGFVDDNITGNPKRAKELFEALIPLKIQWVGQGDLDIAKDPELLKLAVRSGCQGMFIGLESLSQDNLRSTSKVPNIGKDMSEAIKAIHNAGVEIIGSFVLGLDGDVPSTFRRTVEFANKHKLAAAQFSVLTPFPGTAVYRQFEREGRILNFDWSQYTMSNVVFRPKHMTEVELCQGQKYIHKRFYSLPSILRRSLTLRKNLCIRLLVNLSYRNIIHRSRGIHSWLPGQQPIKSFPKVEALNKSPRIPQSILCKLHKSVHELSKALIATLNSVFHLRIPG
jgi:radical SAM superfamily enzyme YgiQ (UPF0313 family)